MARDPILRLDYRGLVVEKTKPSRVFGDDRYRKFCSLQREKLDLALDEHEVSSSWCVKL